VSSEDTVGASALDESATIVTLTRVPGSVPFVIVSAPADENESTEQRMARIEREGRELADVLMSSVQVTVLAVAMSKIKGN
jgi:hypothetical protein